MKKQMISGVHFMFLIFCTLACNNRGDVLKEISIYHTCITICETKADEQIEQKVMQCEAQCTITHINGRNSCLTHHSDNLIHCLEQVDSNYINCKNACHAANQEIIQELKKCKQACVPVLSNSH
jgi:hypothetical protein